MKALLRWLVLIGALAAARPALPDAGVLIPLDREQPDPSVLSLEEMSITVRIDNGDAQVFIRQIYANHTARILEGNYVFALPGRATVSDFAVWDDVTRIPGVILERRRAVEIYNALKWQSIDPGLLQMGEQTAGEARRTAVFSARIVPIPPFGTKRVEIEYHETLPVEDLQSFFAVPLHPDAYQTQVAAHLTIDFELRSQHVLRQFEVVGKTYPLNIREGGPNLIRGSFEGRNVSFQEDFAVRYGFDPSHTDSLAVVTYRNLQPSQPSPTEAAPAPTQNEPGYFEASALFSAGDVGAGSGRSGPAPGAGAPRTVIVLFDTSLSMQWEKLDRSFRALEALLRSLRPADRFNLVLFNTTTNWFSPAPVAAERPAVEKALEFVRKSDIRGRTDIERAFDAALGPAGGRGPGRTLVLLSDGNPTSGAINHARLAARFEKKWQAAPQSERPRIYVFAVGDDADIPLLRMLATDKGVLEQVRSTEPVDFKLNAFLNKIGRSPLEPLQLTLAPTNDFDLVYPLEATVFPGSLGSWVGQYRRPLPEAEFAVQGMREGHAVQFQAKVSLPAQSLDHPDLPRTWARARVDALLAKIEREGEDPATVDEIIRLAKKYKFVTPYTSFLAAPRALLRPRVIRPGDPVLRVRTDPAIVSVVALFPFGLIKKLRYLTEEDIWQTRFLVPPEMTDGTYQVRLILRDRAGNVYRESKSFVIASHPPVLRVNLEKKQVRRGETVAIRVSASKWTRTVVARMYGVPALYLEWTPEVRSNAGKLFIPSDLPAGQYKLTVTAEDVAHNVASEEVALEVVP